MTEPDGGSDALRGKPVSEIPCVPQFLLLHRTSCGGLVRQGGKYWVLCGLKAVPRCDTSTLVVEMPMRKDRLFFIALLKAGESMSKFLFLLLCCGLVTACSSASEIFLSVHQKVTKAFPPSIDVRIAEENLRSLIQQDSVALKAFEEQFASRLELRALTCAQGFSIGRFDLVNTVKTLPLSRDCLSTQDTILATYLGIKRVGLHQSQPALRPLQPLGAPSLIPNLGGIEIYSATAASKAGVAVLRGTRSEFVSVEIPGGKKIATMPSMPDASYRVSLSPNGRVLVVENGNSAVTFLDTQTGEKLWESKSINQFYAWLTDLSAALARDSKSGESMVIDFQLGSIAPHPSALRNQTWGLNLADSTSRVILGSEREFSVLENKRSALGIEGSILKAYAIKSGSGVTSLNPTMVRGGKAIVFISMKDIMSFDLESGKEHLWRTGEFLGNRYAKLSETTLLVDGFDPADRMASKPWVFDIDKSTLSPVETEEARSGIVAELDGRLGFMRRGYQKMWFGDSLKVGAPMELETLLSEFNLARQLARVDAAAQANTLGDPRGIASPGSIVNGSVAAALAAAAATVAAASGAKADASTAARRSAADVAAVAATKDGPRSNPVNAMLPVPADAVVEGVGVYQGGPMGSQSTGGHKTGYVEVRIKRSSKPIVLVLSSYESVRWMLISEPGARLAAVLVSGYYPSQVVGAGSARVVMTGSSYAYKMESPEYRNLNLDALKWTGKSIGLFQGRYAGGSFNVGG